MRVQIFGVLVAMFFVTGCSLIGSFSDRIGNAINRYCEHSEVTREALREYLNARAAPNSIYIACEGDEAPE